MKCPRCGLFNPDTAQRCDCGYDFETKTVQRAYAPESLPRELKTIAVVAAVYSVVLVGAGFATNNPASGVITVVGGPGLVWFSYYHLVRRRNWARLMLAALTFPIGTMLCTTREARLYCLQK